MLVDGDSASAAEMIAGALASYRRAIVIGDRTYGKGYAQEYFDDDAHTGVLRLTTLVYALPDGAPVQKTGIMPHIALSLPAAQEREVQLLKRRSSRGAAPTCATARRPARSRGSTTAARGSVRAATPPSAVRSAPSAPHLQRRAPSRSDRYFFQSLPNNPPPSGGFCAGPAFGAGRLRIS